MTCPVCAGLLKLDTEGALGLGTRVQIVGKVAYPLIPGPYTYKPFEQLDTVTIRGKGTTYLKFLKTDKAEEKFPYLRERNRVRVEGCLHHFQRSETKRRTKGKGQFAYTYPIKDRGVDVVLDVSSAELVAGREELQDS